MQFHTLLKLCSICIVCCVSLQNAFLHESPWEIHTSYIFKCLHVILHFCPLYCWLVESIYIFACLHASSTIFSDCVYVHWLVASCKLLSVESSWETLISYNFSDVCMQLAAVICFVSRVLVLIIWGSNYSAVLSSAILRLLGAAVCDSIWRTVDCRTYLGRYSQKCYSSFLLWAVQCRPDLLMRLTSYFQLVCVCLGLDGSFLAP